MSLHLNVRRLRFSCVWCEENTLKTSKLQSNCGKQVTSVSFWEHFHLGEATRMSLLVFWCPTWTDVLLVCQLWCQGKVTRPRVDPCSVLLVAQRSQDVISSCLTRGICICICSQTVGEVRSFSVPALTTDLQAVLLSSLWFTTNVVSVLTERQTSISAAVMEQNWICCMIFAPY